MSNNPAAALVISAPSGAGKSTLIRHLLERRPRLAFSVSCTTRPPRTGEREGENYYFLTREEFERRRKQGLFLEWEEVHGNFYGTLFSEIERLHREGRIPVFDLDVKGALQVKKQLPGARLVFITVPDRETFRKRLLKRGTESPAEIEKRLQRLPMELSLAHQFHYQVVNPDLEKTVKELVALMDREFSANEQN